jgi:hypothetical protein
MSGRGLLTRTGAKLPFDPAEKMTYELLETIYRVREFSYAPALRIASRRPRRSVCDPDFAGQPAEFMREVD